MIYGVLIVIKLYKDEGNYDLVDEKEVKELTQSLGEISYMYDICGNSFAGFICEDCRKYGNDKGCSKTKTFLRRLSDPESIQVTFKDGSIKFYYAWEKTDEI